MFNKLKQIKDMRDKAKELQAALSEEKIDVQHKGIELQMDGSLKLLAIKLPEDMMSDKIRLESALVDAYNEAVKKVQKAMAIKMQKMGNLDIPGLS